MMTGVVIHVIFVVIHVIVVVIHVIFVVIRAIFVVIRIIFVVIHFILSSFISFCHHSFHLPILLDTLVLHDSRLFSLKYTYKENMVSSIYKQCLCS